MQAGLNLQTRDFFHSLLTSSATLVADEVTRQTQSPVSRILFCRLPKRPCPQKPAHRRNHRAMGEHRRMGRMDHDVSGLRQFPGFVDSGAWQHDAVTLTALRRAGNLSS